MKTDTQHSAPITRTQTSSDGEDASPPPLAGTPPVSSQPLPRGVRVPLPDTRGPAAVFLPRSTTRPPRPPHTTRAWGAQPPQVCMCVPCARAHARCGRGGAHHNSPRGAAVDRKGPHRLLLSRHRAPTPEALGAYARAKRAGARRCCRFWCYRRCWVPMLLERGVSDDARAA